MSIAQKNMVNFREVVRLGNRGVLGEHDPSTAPAVCHLNLSPELLMSIPWILVDAGFKFKLSENLTRLKTGTCNLNVSTSTCSNLIDRHTLSNYPEMRAVIQRVSSASVSGASLCSVNQDFQAHCTHS